MAIVTNSPRDFKDVYKGFDVQDVGLGTIGQDYSAKDEQTKRKQVSDPGIYHSASYRKKKVYKVLIGGLQLIKYAGFNTDKEPLFLCVAYETKYNTVIGYNLHYIPVKDRKMVLKHHIRTNLPRIKGQQPLIVHYERLESLVPSLKGAIRRYKIVGVRVVDTYPLLEWDDAVKGRGPWSNWYRQDQKASTFTTIKHFFQKFIGNPHTKKKK